MVVPSNLPRAPGSGVLAIERGRAGSVVTRAVARSPLALLVPRNHGHAVWAFLSSHGGGLVDGDEMALDVRVGEGAAALVTTQASTKVYRSPRGCRQRLGVDVADGGLLVVLPDPITCFAGARLEQTVDIHLAERSSLILVDSSTCGRAARGERWAFDCYRSAISIRRGERLVLRDVIELDRSAGELAARMGRFDGLATIVAVGPVAALFEPSSSSLGPDWIAALSPIDEGFLLRAAASSAASLHAGVRATLTPLPAVLGDDPFARKY